MDKWYIVNNREKITMGETSILELHKIEDIEQSTNNNLKQKKNTTTKTFSKNNEKLTESWENFIKFESAWAL